MLLKRFLPVSLCLFLAAPAYGATATIQVISSVIGNQLALNGTPDRIFEQGGTEIVHPFEAAFNGYYTSLSGLESFDFDLGTETPLGFNPITSTTYVNPVAPDPPAFSATIPAGHGLAVSGLVSSDSNPIHLALRGFTLDLQASTDFFIDTGSLVETRHYRGGELGLFEEIAANTYGQVYLATGLTATITIDWPEVIDGDTENDIGISITGFPSLGADPQNPLFAINSYDASSGTPVQLDGNSADGPFAVYPSDATIGLEFLPEPSVPMFLSLFAIMLTLRRSRNGQS